MQSAIRDWPAGLRPSQVSFWLETNAASFESPWTRQTQILERPGARWRCELGFENQDRGKTAAMDGFLAGLRGPVNLVRLYDFRRPRPLKALPTGADFAGGETYYDDSAFDDGRGFDEAVPGAPVVHGGDQSGSALATRGWHPSRLVLRAGDYIQMGENRLHIVTADAWSDASGICVLPVAPDVFHAPFDGYPLTCERPTACFRLVDNAQAKNQTRWPWWGSFSLSFVQTTNSIEDFTMGIRAPVSATLTAENAFTDKIFLKGYFNFSVRGDFRGVVRLQKSFDAGVTWVFVADGDASQVIAKVLYEPEGLYYRAGFLPGQYFGGSAFVRLGQ